MDFPFQPAPSSQICPATLPPPTETPILLFIRCAAPPIFPIGLVLLHLDAAAAVCQYEHFHCWPVGPSRTANARLEESAFWHLLNRLRAQAHASPTWVIFFLLSASCPRGLTAVTSEIELDTVRLLNWPRQRHICQTKTISSSRVL
ncbi:hypothetical protein ACN47E_007154 [Coniothyrium glycines]